MLETFFDFAQTGLEVFAAGFVYLWTSCCSPWPTGIFPLKPSHRPPLGIFLWRLACLFATWKWADGPMMVVQNLSVHLSLSESPDLPLYGNAREPPESWCRVMFVAQLFGNPPSAEGGSARQKKAALEAPTSARRHLAPSQGALECATCSIGNWKEVEKENTEKGSPHSTCVPCTEMMWVKQTRI